MAESKPQRRRTFKKFRSFGRQSSALGFFKQKKTFFQFNLQVHQHRSMLAGQTCQIIFSSDFSASSRGEKKCNFSLPQGVLIKDFIVRTSQAIYIVDSNRVYHTTSHYELYALESKLGRSLKRLPFPREREREREQSLTDF